jgi:DNA-binding response OmpR family regulator
MRVLLAGSHRPMIRALRQSLEEEGFTVDVAVHGNGANDEVPAMDYDAMVLDVIHPDCRDLPPEFRWPGRSGHRPPILVLTPPGGCNATNGRPPLTGDDWLTKPFDLEELFIRLRGLGRRDGSMPGSSRLKRVRKVTTSSR